MLEKLIEKKYLIVICGPTASGKTDLSLELAGKYNSEIISADSRQIYKYMDIGTAKPNAKELSVCKHHFIDSLTPDENYSAGKFGKEAYQKVNQIFDNKILPIVVGGSGLYIKALCEGLFDEGDSDSLSDVRIELENEFKTNGINSLAEKLKEVDFKSYSKYEDKNPRRIIRALEYYMTNGKAFSDAHIELDESRDLNPIYFCIDYKREELYNRINKRTNIMWESGLKNETLKLLEMGYSPELNSLNTVGYKETIAHINGEISEKKAIELIAQHTRNYAKRQLTWFRKVPNIYFIKNSVDEIINVIKNVAAL